MSPDYVALASGDSTTAVQTERRGLVGLVVFVVAAVAAKMVGLGVAWLSDVGIPLERAAVGDSGPESARKCLLGS